MNANVLIDFDEVMTRKLSADNIGQMGQETLMKIGRLLALSLLLGVLAFCLPVPHVEQARAETPKKAKMLMLTVSKK